VAPIIVFPDAAELVCTWLRYQMNLRGRNSVHVGTVIPQPRPTEMVIARRVGGQRVTPVTDAVDMSLECFAATDSAAQDLAQLVRGLVHALAGTVAEGVPVYRVDDLVGLDDLPDPLSDQSRYTLSVSVTVRGTADPWSSN
jgi:hypothetical protein